jgi:hypothetical protein
MTNQAIDLAAYYAARRLTKLVAPALLPAERREYFREAHRVIRLLLKSSIKSDERSALPHAAPSMN